MVNRYLLFVSKWVLNLLLGFQDLFFSFIYFSNQKNGFWFFRLALLFQFFTLRFSSDLLRLSGLMPPHFGEKIIKASLIFISLVWKIGIFVLEGFCRLVRVRTLCKILLKMFIFDCNVRVICFFFENVEATLDPHMFLVFNVIGIILLWWCVCYSKICRSIQYLGVITFLRTYECRRWVRNTICAYFRLFELFKWKTSASVIIGHLIKINYIYYCE